MNDASHAINDALVAANDAGVSELRKHVELYRAYAGLFRDNQIGRALTEYAALLEAKAEA